MSWVFIQLLQSFRHLMNIFLQFLHGYAQNQMEGTVLNALENALWYSSLNCSQNITSCIRDSEQQFSQPDGRVISDFGKFSH